jgi:hypothetical protein
VDALWGKEKGGALLLREKVAILTAQGQPLHVPAVGASVVVLVTLWACPGWRWI